MWLAARVALGVLMFERLARATEPEVAELEYDRADLSECPAEEDFRQRVAERLGRDPFLSGAARKIRVELTRRGSTLRALVRVAEAGQPHGERRIETRGSCEELVSGAALAVSIAIDPLVALGPASPEPAVASAPEPVPKPEPPLARKVPVPAPPAPQRARAASRTHAFVRAGARAWAGLVPQFSAGPSLGVGVQQATWSIAADGFAALPRTERETGTPRAASVSLLGVELAPCGRYEGIRLCALFATGALLARGEGVTDPRTRSTWHAAAGAGIGYTFSVGRFSFTPSAAASLRLLVTELSLNDQPVWRTPRWIGSFGLEVAHEFGPR